MSNLLRAERGDVTKGSIEFRGKRVDRMTPPELVKQGVIQVMEGRRCFPHLTVEENLLTGAYTRKVGRAEIKRDLERVYAYFLPLKERRNSLAGYTSGGEQQMMSIGRALMAQPAMILLDEPSMGLAPQLVEEIFQIVRDLNQKEKVSFLLAEQNTNVALRFADFGYILENGRVVMDGKAADLAANEDVKEFYLGISSGARISGTPSTIGAQALAGLESPCCLVFVDVLRTPEKLNMPDHFYTESLTGDVAGIIRSHEAGGCCNLINPHPPKGHPFSHTINYLRKIHPWQFDL